LRDSRRIGQKKQKIGLRRHAAHHRAPHMAHEPVAHAPRRQPLKLIEGTVMKLILIAATAATLASTSAFACNGIYTPGVHCPQWEMMPMQTPQPSWRPTPLPVPQTTYGSIGNQSFGITRWPNGYITIDR
jgi:hypothetical protein